MSISAGAKNKKTLKNLIAAAAQGAGINDSDGLGYTPEVQPHSKKRSHKNKQAVPTLEDNIAASMQNSFSGTIDDNPFKVNMQVTNQYYCGIISFGFIFRHSVDLFN